MGGSRKEECAAQKEDREEVGRRGDDHEVPKRSRKMGPLIVESSFPLHPCLGSVLGIAGMGTRGKIGAVVVSSGPTARFPLSFLLASCPVESEDDREEPKKKEGVWM